MKTSQELRSSLYKRAVKYTGKPVNIVLTKDRKPTRGVIKGAYGKTFALVDYKLGRRQIKYSDVLLITLDRRTPEVIR